MQGYVYLKRKLSGGSILSATIPAVTEEKHNNNFKLALCACASGWSSTLEPRSKLGNGSIWSIQRV